MSGAPNADRPLWRSVLPFWAGMSALITLTCAGEIASQHYPDPDDTLRRLEVRDWLGGQSWWDVSQHRLASGAMHWSRLVDLPLAGVILPLRPLLGEEGAERVAMVVVPLLTFGIVLALGVTLARRLLDGERARMVLLVAPLSVPLMFQLRPMRIDHHGWQVVLAMAALLAFTRERPGVMSGVVGGAMLALLLTISLEGLPIAVALLGLVALAWALIPARRAQLVGAGTAAVAGASLLHLATHAPDFFAPACDAMSPVWLAVLAVAAAGTALATLASAKPLVVRLALLALGAAACGGAMLLVDPRCVAGPFSGLDPLVRLLWYDKVLEGLPIWDQQPAWALMSVGLPLVALGGSVAAWRASEGERRVAWALVLGAQVATLLLALEVSRAAATANAVALPGAAVVLFALLSRARQVPRVLPRVAATAGALLSTAPGLAAFPFLLAGESAAAAANIGPVDRLGIVPCLTAEDPRALAQLAPARIFAPLDGAPEIIAATGHHAIASGHHRNAAAMRDVIAAYVASPDHARRIVEHYHADYLVGCPGGTETSLYRTVSPNGLWARLERGETVGWLRRVKLPGSPVLVWRVVRAE